MPVIGIPIAPLRRRLGAEISAERLLDVLAEIGCDVEGYARLKRTRCRLCSWVEERTDTEDPPARCDRCDVDHRSDPGTLEELPDLEVVRMELLAVRPDMFDPGGLARALRGYLGTEIGLPQYEAGEEVARVRVDPALCDPESFRPHIACAVFEQVALDSDSVKILMKLQENLHWALGRNRKHASIGVYDFDTVAPEITYTTGDPKADSFVPLGSLDGRPIRLETILEEHPKGRAFRHLLEGYRRYPLLRDAEGRVLSMPPIINSEETKVHIGSRRLFIDVTGIGERVVQRTLNILVTSLLENLASARVRTVRIEDGKGSIVTPNFTPQPARLSVAATAKLLGIPLDAGRAVDLLGRMRHGARTMDADTIAVQVPSYRNDILHERDLMEDIAIAHGYHRIVPELLPARTVGRPLPLEVLTGRIREILCGLGLQEVTTLVLTSDDAHDLALGLPADGRAVRIENPISAEQSRVRTRLLSGILEVFRHNMHQPLPQRIFEVGDVTWLDPGAETGAFDTRMAAIGLIDPKVGFTEIRAIVDALVREVDAKVSYEAAEEPPFLKGRCARLVARDGTAVGIFGEVDPAILTRFGFGNPSVLAEVWIEALAGMHPRTRFKLEEE